MDGVDLNRNWGHNFSGGADPRRSPCVGTFYGAAPFSEPESRALRDLIQANPGIDTHIDFHSFGQLVLRPWSFTENKTNVPPREASNCGVGNAMGDAMTSRHGLPYNVTHGTFLYTVGGTMTDWVASQNILSYTIELRPSMHGVDKPAFLLPEDEILPTCQEGFEAVKTLLRFASDPDSFDNKCVRATPPTDPGSSPNELEPGGSAVDWGFVFGLAGGGGLFVVLLVMIVIVSRRSRHTSPPPEHLRSGNG
ncbi:unnamed protein product [Chondrus crispus]|uniref:Peptidase M14 domain-containing protein n=1 Tax=Chondrus crispus TaxID=2769 RepID=R7QVE0_CHOCR|nr:unnamed protein product [Chondrus crispus]CDF41310.1 unnamed protein product [Chondrus crispus]|eukprot:XP_005711604.1 unnamed protein product [Chondrus crispus]